MNLETSRAAPAGWDAYVDAHPQASAYHRSTAVDIASQAFGLPVYFIVARMPDGNLGGVLPLVEQSSLMFGRYLVSVPYFTYGGLLASTPEIALRLVEEAGRLGTERRAQHVELRHNIALPSLALPERLDKVSMVLPLPPTAAELSQRLGSKLRSQIKRAERERPEIRWGGKELLDQFYEVFAAGMHELGTPVYSRRFFDVVSDAMGERLAVIVVLASGRVEAGAVLVRHPQSIEVPWAAASGRAKRGALNMRMYWEMLKYAVEANAGAFDFGRSTVDSGTYRFKAQWGARPVQLHWHYWLPRAAELPKLNHSNPKYARAAALWRRMPLWCANVLGPLIARYLP
jgi:FemAB-related protein (PEP-CTERM system-associated)